MSPKASRPPRKRRTPANTKTPHRRTTSPPVEMVPALRRFYVRHYPPGELSETELQIWSPRINEYDLPFDTLVSLAVREIAYTRTRNPVLVLEAFRAAHHVGLYPPLWVLDALAKGFQAYQEMQDPEGFPLDKALGLKPERGKSIPLKTLFEEQRDGVLTLDVYRLALLGHPVGKATDMVASRLKNEKRWDRTGLGLATLTAATIKDRYYRTWRRLWDRADVKKAVVGWTPAERAAFLKRFSLPAPTSK